MDRSSLTIKRGETGIYRIRLSEPPIADNWWLFIFADGEKRSDGEYEGLSRVPSIGWEFRNVIASGEGTCCAGGTVAPTIK